MPRLLSDRARRTLEKTHSGLLEAAALREGGPTAGDMEQIDRASKLLGITGQPAERQRASRRIVAVAVLAAGAVVAGWFLHTPSTTRGDITASAVSFRAVGRAELSTDVALARAVVFGSDGFEVEAAGMSRVPVRKLVLTPSSGQSLTLTRLAYEGGTEVRLSVVPQGECAVPAVEAGQKGPRGGDATSGFACYRLTTNERREPLVFRSHGTVDLLAEDEERNSVHGVVQPGTNVLIVGNAPVKLELLTPKGDTVPSFRRFEASELRFESAELQSVEGTLRTARGSSIKGGAITNEGLPDSGATVEAGDSIHISRGDRLIVSALKLLPAEISVSWTNVAGDVHIEQQGVSRSLRPNLVQRMRGSRDLQVFWASLATSLSILLGAYQWLREPR